MTHLFNAMGALHHRELGTVGAALADDRLLCGLIADGLHCIRRSCGWPGTASGRSAPCWCPTPSGRSVRRRGPTGWATPWWWRTATGWTRDGRLAGSLLGLDAGLRTMLAAGASAADAVAAATATPAALLGLADRGHLRRGAVATWCC